MQSSICLLRRSWSSYCDECHVYHRSSHLLLLCWMQHGWRKFARPLAWDLYLLLPSWKLAASSSLWFSRWEALMTEGCYLYPPLIKEMVMFRKMVFSKVVVGNHWNWGPQSQRHPDSSWICWSLAFFFQIRWVFGAKTRAFGARRCPPQTSIRFCPTWSLGRCPEPSDGPLLSVLCCMENKFPPFFFWMEKSAIDYTININYLLIIYNILIILLFYKYYLVLSLDISRHPCLNSCRCILGKRGKTIGVVQPMAIRASQNAAIAFAKDSPTAEKCLCRDDRKSIDVRKGLKYLLSLLWCCLLVVWVE